MWIWFKHVRFKSAFTIAFFCAWTLNYSDMILLLKTIKVTKCKQGIWFEHKWVDHGGSLGQIKKEIS